MLAVGFNPRSSASIGSESRSDDWPCALIVLFGGPNNSVLLTQSACRNRVHSAFEFLIARFSTRPLLRPAIRNPRLAACPPPWQTRPTQPSPTRCWSLLLRPSDLFQPIQKVHAAAMPRKQSIPVRSPSPAVVFP